MPYLLHDLIINTAKSAGNNIALTHKKKSLSYTRLATEIATFANSLLSLGLSKSERIAVYLPKQFETVISFFATSLAGGVFVPVNPLLKPAQLGYILRDCNVRILITSTDRANLLTETLAQCHDLQHLITTGEKSLDGLTHLTTHRWQDLPTESKHALNPPVIDTDMAAILYTSGSTGKPKGVVLSHRNMVTGAKSVAEYLQNTATDKLLAVLPFSFDYGFSQLSSAFSVSANVVLMDYLLPRDVIKAVIKNKITGLAGVPPLWNQLAQLDWPDDAKACLRYTTNSGGAMPKATLSSLRRMLPNTDFYLMYGLTEAFRSTFLSPKQIDKRPDSMGKAIPNAEVMVVREDGSPCAPGEPGELVHRGSLVALGYWNDSDKTAERFKPAPAQLSGLKLPEIAVWSGDTVRMDEEGYLYFVARKDDMIKTSGYRVSPTEIEEVIYSSGLVSETVALGISHPTLGQAIAVVVTTNHKINTDDIINECKKHLPNFMIPHSVEIKESLPKNPNGKIDRKRLTTEYQDLFKE